jgi:ribosome-associated protein
MARFDRHGSHPGLAHRRPSEQDPTEEGADERPSKSARKRAAHAAQALGEQLIALKESELTTLELPETLLTAIRDAKRIKAHGGLARQKQYIGKLMRDLDTPALITALENLRHK